jgi:D-beta-D-heptose 7-phosphate kinase/D-beta-D-heptose 1-phosphate adenosyltransferase
MLKDFKKKHLLVIGDVMLDEYVWGHATRISPEAPVPVVEVHDRTYHLGGAANTVSNIMALGARATLLGVVGSDTQGRLLKGIFKDAGIGTDLIMTAAKRPTTTKIRIVAQGQQVMRADQEEIAPMAPRLARSMVASVEKIIDEIHGIAVSDYNKGVINPTFMSGLLPLAREHNVPMAVDLKPANMTLFKGVTLVTPNRVEAEALSGIRIRDDASLREAGLTILRRMGVAYVSLTLGADGVALFGAGREMKLIPSVATQVYDVTGAGDTVMAVLALCLACGHDMNDAIALANFAAGLVVRKRGTATATARELTMFIKGVL